jgi:hypothetical protein
MCEVDRPRQKPQQSVWQEDARTSMVSNRHGMGAALGAALIALLAACGGDDPSGPTGSAPDVVGTYDGSWSFRFTYTSTGAEEEVICPGVLSIVLQRPDGTFTGTWAEQPEGEDCHESSGTLSGIIEPDGDVTIVSLKSDVVGGGTTLEEYTDGECATTSLADAYRGVADGSTFQISYTIAGDCGAVGPVEWVTTFSGLVAPEAGQ